MLLHMHKWLNHILSPMHMGSLSNQIMSCTYIIHMFFPKVEDLCQEEYFFVSNGGENFSKGEHSFRGSYNVKFFNWF
jgi:hypothetical protein